MKKSSENLKKRKIKMEEYRAYIKFLRKELIAERKRADDRQAENVVLYVLLIALSITLAFSFIH